MQDTGAKGDIGVAMITADLIAQGGEVLQPVSHSAPYDLGLYIQGKFYRVQVKYREPNKRGAVEITARRRNSKGSSKIIYESNKEFEILAVYTPEFGCCYIHIDDYVKDTVSFRVKPPKSNQKIGVRFFENYTSVLDCLKK